VAPAHTTCFSLKREHRGFRNTNHREFPDGADSIADAYKAGDIPPIHDNIVIAMIRPLPCLPWTSRPDVLNTRVYAQTRRIDVERAIFELEVLDDVALELDTTVDWLHYAVAAVQRLLCDDAFYSHAARHWPTVEVRFEDEAMRRLIAWLWYVERHVTGIQFKMAKWHTELARRLYILVWNLRGAPSTGLIPKDLFTHTHVVSVTSLQLFACDHASHRHGVYTVNIRVAHKVRVVLRLDALLELLGASRESLEVQAGLLESDTPVDRAKKMLKVVRSAVRPLRVSFRQLLPVSLDGGLDLPMRVVKSVFERPREGKPCVHSTVKQPLGRVPCNLLACSACGLHGHLP
jgi:hypothetical protein